MSEKKPKKGNAAGASASREELLGAVARLRQRLDAFDALLADEDRWARTLSLDGGSVAREILDLDRVSRRQRPAWVLFVELLENACGVGKWTDSERVDAVLEFFADERPGHPTLERDRVAKAVARWGAGHGKWPAVAALFEGDETSMKVDWSKKWRARK